MLRTLTHPSRQHNALTVNWEATVGEQVSRGSRRLKRPQTEPFHDTAARILPAERDDTLPARLTVFDEPLKLTKNFSKLGLGCSANARLLELLFQGVGVGMLGVSKPGLISRRFSSVRTSRPAPMSTRTDNATCATTSELPRRNRPTRVSLPRIVEAFSLSAGAKSTRVLRNAGARPKAIPVRIDTPSASERTRQSAAITYGNLPLELPINSAAGASLVSCPRACTRATLCASCQTQTKNEPIPPSGSDC